MVFSSVPAYFDPSNWHQQQQHQQQQQNQAGFHHGINNNTSLTNPNPLLPPPPLPPPQHHPRAQPPPQTGPMALPLGSIRPGSMAERARMANIPMPEMALQCPRCESTNTKFCYFNNYSLSQPRHFCKTCRRYWTRGGALRNVPVGGGCRRNKRSKSSSSKSTSSSSAAAAATSSATSGTSLPGPHAASMAEMMGLTSPPPPPGLSPLRFMSPLHQMTSDFGEPLGLSSYDVAASGFHHLAPQFLQGILDHGGGSGSSLYGNIPFEAVEFSNLAIGGSGGPVRLKAAEGNTEAVKAEERGGGMSLMRRFNIGINNNNDNHSHTGNVGEENYNWGGGSSSSGNAWTDIAAHNNSSCSNAGAL